ncbi:MAG: hypothetical protein RLZZ265_2017 [Verrucomicrobiota bacterium]|jgi:hypothetical protein
MSLLEIENEAKALSIQERAALVTTLLDTLPGSAYDVSDEEVAQRDRELEEGLVEPLSQAEFVRRIELERRA